MIAIVSNIQHHKRENKIAWRKWCIISIKCDMCSHLLTSFPTLGIIGSAIHQNKRKLTYMLIKLYLVDNQNLAYTPPGKLKLRQILALCDFSSADYPPPPSPPPKLKLRQILALCDFSSADYPPPPRKIET